MGDATTEFFEQLRNRRHEPMLAGITSTFRFELEDGAKTERWHVAVTKGDIAVSQRNARADCVMRMSRKLSNQVTSGERNVVAAFMRGEIGLEGDWNLMVQLQRLLPGPAESRRTWETRRRS